MVTDRHDLRQEDAGGPGRLAPGTGLFLGLGRRRRRADVVLDAVDAVDAVDGGRRATSWRLRSSEGVGMADGGTYLKIARQKLKSKTRWLRTAGEGTRGRGDDWDATVVTSAAGQEAAVSPRPIRKSPWPEDGRAERPWPTPPASASQRARQKRGGEGTEGPTGGTEGTEETEGKRTEERRAKSVERRALRVVLCRPVDLLSRCCATSPSCAARVSICRPALARRRMASRCDVAPALR